MKKILILLTALLLISLVTIMAFAHSGRTDSNGGHYDHSTGEYHYHHGYPAHQHTGGVCPYSNSGTSASSSKSSSDYSADDDEPLIWVPIVSVTVASIIFMLFALEVLEKLNETVQKVFVGILIAAILVSMICLAAVPGAVLLTAAIEGVICWIIWVIIDNRKYNNK